MQQIIIPLKITNTASSAANDHCHNPSHHNQLYVYDYSIMYYCTNWSCQLPQICGSKSPKAMHFLWWLWWWKQSSKKQCLDHWTEYTHTSGMCTTQPLHFCAKNILRKYSRSCLPVIHQSVAANWLTKLNVAKADIKTQMQYNGTAAITLAV